MEDDPLGVKSREVFSMGLAGGRGISSQDTLGWPTLCEFVSRKGWVTPVEIMVHIFWNRSAGTRALSVSGTLCNPGNHISRIDSEESVIPKFSASPASATSIMPSPSLRPYPPYL